jgi:hypothetical protein
MILSISFSANLSIVIFGFFQDSSILSIYCFQLNPGKNQAETDLSSNQGLIFSEFCYGWILAEYYFDLKLPFFLGLKGHSIIAQCRKAWVNANNEKRPERPT